MEPGQYRDLQRNPTLPLTLLLHCSINAVGGVLSSTPALVLRLMPTLLCVALSFPEAEGDWRGGGRRDMAGFVFGHKAES